MDVHKCNFYVFVARDRDEFERYSRFGYGFKSLRLKDVDILWKQKNETVVFVLSEVAKPEKPEGISTLCNHVSAAILDGNKHLVEDFYKLTNRECVSIFVHWGGDDWEKMEVTAQNALKNSAYTNWSVFAISSTRTDIGVEPGRIPDSKEALEDIVYRCKDAASDEILTHLAAQSLLNERDKKIVEERLVRLKNRLLLSSIKYDKKRMMLKEIQQALQAIKSGDKDGLDKAAPFFAKILNKEVFNG